MNTQPITYTVTATRKCARFAILISLALSVSACAGSGPFEMTSLSDERKEMTASEKAALAGQTPQSELQKATQYWGKKFAKNPRDATMAVNYARNLKAMGEKRRALAVLQQASIFNGNSQPLASEYGRLALELGQTSLASKLLRKADNPAKPDWRVVSARGTALAKLGKHKEALRYFERASILAPKQPTVQNNLAMAYTMDGQPAKAEALLRKALATATPKTAGRVKQNLALVLGLQGKYDEAKAIGSQQLGERAAQANVKAIRQLVRLKPKLSPEAQAENIVEMAKAEALKQSRSAKPTRTAKRVVKRAKKRVALRRTKIKPAATATPKAAKVATARGPYVLRPTVHTAK